MAFQQSPYSTIVNVQWGDVGLALGTHVSFILTSRDGTTWANRGAFGQLGLDSEENWGNVQMMTRHKARNELYAICQSHNAALPGEGPEIIRSADGITWETALTVLGLAGAGVHLPAASWWIGYDESTKRIYVQLVENHEPDPPVNVMIMSENGTSWSLADKSDPFGEIVSSRVIDWIDNPDGTARVTAYARMPVPFSRNLQKPAQSATRNGQIQISRNKSSWFTVNTGLAVPSGFSRGVTKIVGANGLFVASGHKGIAVSENAVDWSMVYTSSEPIEVLAFANGAFISFVEAPLGAGREWFMIRSEDGFTWERVDPPFLSTYGFPLALAQGRVRAD